MSAMIHLDDVSVAFGAEVIYDRLSFAVEDGEFVCLLGPSGCGKSTLLRVIGDLLAADSGDVRVDGRPASEAWQEIAYVFQSPRLLPWRDAESNVMLSRQLRFGHAGGAAQRRAQARELLELVGLGRDMKKMPAVLSGGERQRVSIARALAVEPRIILMDEPFSALDINTRKRMRAEIIDIWRKTQKTIVFVTHDIDEAIDLADRVVVLSAKPTKVVEIVRIDAERPRDFRQPEIMAVQDRLRQLLNEASNLTRPKIDKGEERMRPIRPLQSAFCVGVLLAFCVNAIAAEKVTIGSLRDPAHHAVVWPIINGKVKDPNLDVAIELLSIPASYQAVLTKQYDAVIMATAGLPRLAEQGLGFKVFALLYRYSRDGNGASVWVLKDSPYKTIDDLKGKRIATAALESGGTVAVRSVLQQKYKMNAATVGGDFEWVQLPTSQMRTALKARRVEAALVPNLEAVLTEKEGLYRPVLVGQKDIYDLYGVPMPATFFGSYDELLKKRPEAFKALVALLKKSSDYMKANPDEVYAGVAKEYGIKPEDLTVWMNAFGDFPIVIGKDDRKGMEEVWKSSQALGLLKNAPPPVDSLVWDSAASQ